LRIPLNTGGYLISRQGAEKMLRPGARVRPIDQDIKFAWLRGLDVLGIYPSPVSRDTSFRESTIDAAKLRDRRAGVWRPKGYLLRRQLHAARKLGISAYLACWWAGFLQRMGKSRGAIVLIVTTRARTTTPRNGVTIGWGAR
jgi:GR25 family glycosyltransferase involved in LPS biosynthesis